MPKFLAGCHYNEEVSQHLKQNIGYWPVQINGNKFEFATGQVLKKPVEVVKGRRVLANWAQKSPEPCSLPLPSHRAPHGFYNASQNGLWALLSAWK